MSGKTLHDQPVPIVNTTSQVQTLPSGFQLGNLSPVKVLGPESGEQPSDLSVKPTDETRVTQKLVDGLPVDLTKEQRESVVSFLDEYDALFSRGPFDMGRTHLVEHRIDTGDARPIRQGLRRHPLSQMDEIDRQVSEMVTHDIVEPAASEWASNVVMV